MSPVKAGTLSHVTLKEEAGPSVCAGAVSTLEMWAFLIMNFLSPSLLSQCLQNPSSDIRLVAEKMIWWANKEPRPALEPQAIKPILKALLDNTKDKNTVVRAYSEQAIVNLLKLRQGEELLQVRAQPGASGTHCGCLSICPVPLDSSPETLFSRSLC